LRSETLGNCRYLRKNATDAESLLWSVLRNRQVLGVKFRRQHQIGEYIIDFYCPEIKVAVESDGIGYKFKVRREKDKIRDEYLKSVGVDVVRF